MESSCPPSAVGPLMLNPKPPLCLRNHKGTRDKQTQCETPDAWMDCSFQGMSGCGVNINAIAWRYGPCCRRWGGRLHFWVLWLAGAEPSRVKDRAHTYPLEHTHTYTHTRLFLSALCSEEDNICIGT